jgi:hypothetical protein
VSPQKSAQLRSQRLELKAARRRDLATDLAHQLLLFGKLLQNTRELDEQGPFHRVELLTISSPRVLPDAFINASEIETTVQKADVAELNITALRPEAASRSEAAFRTDVAANSRSQECLPTPQLAVLGGGVVSISH